ncbi:MAG: ribose-phosphate pyrophosphokinase [bacterium]
MGTSKRRTISKADTLCLVSGNGNKPLAKEIAGYLGLQLVNVEVTRFNDGEIRVVFNESMRGMDVFIIQSTCHPVNDNLMELLVMTDALKRASANTINAVMPYYGYARQDKKVKPREPITAKLVGDMLKAAGVDRVLTMDLHAPSIQGFFDIPVDHLSSIPTVAAYLKRRNICGEDLMVVSPDVGGVTRAREISDRLSSPLSIVTKRRLKPNEVETKEIIGTVKGCRCLMVDDMIDTAGTLVMGAQALMDAGAKEVMAYATHPVFSGDAVGKIDKSLLKEVIVTNTIPLPDKKKNNKIKSVSVANVFGEAILRGYRKESISALFR